MIFPNEKILNWNLFMPYSKLQNLCSALSLLSYLWHAAIICGYFTLKNNVFTEFIIFTASLSLYLEH